MTTDEAHDYLKRNPKCKTIVEGLTPDFVAKMDYIAAMGCASNADDASKNLLEVYRALQLSNGDSK